MPFVDSAADLLLRTVRRAAWLDHVVDLAAWLVTPLSLITLAVTGELMAYGSRLTGLPAFSTLRGMHVLAGGILFVVILYRGACGGWWLFRRGVTRHDLAALAERSVRSAEPFVRVGTWTCLLIVVITGLGRHARLRYGWSPLPPGEPALWDVIHITTVPYFYGFLVLEAYLRVRRWLPALRDYLVRQY